MRRVLVALVVVVLATTGIVGCSRAEPTAIKLPTVMKTCYVTGSHTPEAVFLEIDWLELETGLGDNLGDNES